MASHGERRARQVGQAQVAGGEARLRRAAPRSSRRACPRGSRALRHGGSWRASLSPVRPRGRCARVIPRVATGATVGHRLPASMPELAPHRRQAGHRPHLQDAQRRVLEPELDVERIAGRPRSSRVATCTSSSSSDVLERRRAAAGATARRRERCRPRPLVEDHALALVGRDVAEPERLVVRVVLLRDERRGPPRRRPRRRPRRDRGRR